MFELKKKQLEENILYNRTNLLDVRVAGACTWCKVSFDARVAGNQILQVITAQKFQIIWSDASNAVYFYYMDQESCDFFRCNISIQLWIVSELSRTTQKSRPVFMYWKQAKLDVRTSCAPSYNVMARQTKQTEIRSD